MTVAELSACHDDPMTDNSSAEMIAFITTQYDRAEAAALNGPDWVLADIASKRRILTEIVDEANDLDDSLDLERRVGQRDLVTEPRLGDLLLKILAEPYSSRDGYKETWRP